MAALFIVFYLIAAACFGLAAFGVASRVNLMALGLLAWVLVPLIQSL